jgi:proteasome-associated ATPase
VAKLAGEEGRGADRPGQRPGVLPQHQGPELLNKYVGETERQIRLVFQRRGRRRPRACPSSSSSTRWTRSSAPAGRACPSDVENTIVPQLLSEIDGVEQLENVIVIGASNREDMIDPAILRPGPARREDQGRSDRTPRRQKDIFAKYVRPELPLHATTWPSTAADGKRPARR